MSKEQQVFLKVKDSSSTRTVDWPFREIPQMGDTVYVLGVAYRVINRDFRTDDIVDEGGEPSVRINVWMEPYK